METLNNDLGRFEGFNFKTQSAIPYLLTADEVLNWDHDKKGEAEFWTHGDNDFACAILKGKNSVTAAELRALDALMDEVSESDLPKLIYCVDCLMMDIESIDRHTIENLNVYVYSGDCFCDIIKEAAWDLFENCYPTEYKAYEASHCPGLTFDHDAFMRSYSTYELEIKENQKYLIVSMD